MPTFNDPALQAVHDEMSRHIDRRDDNLTSISDDIKALEQYLRDAIVQHEFHVVLDQHPGGWERDDRESVFEHTHQLAWVKPHDAKNWRIFYVHQRRLMGESDGDAFFEGPPGPPEIVECRPLIETRSEVRVRAHRAGALGRLVRAVGEHYRIEPEPPAPASAWDDEDIPF